MPLEDLFTHRNYKVDITEGYTWRGPLRNSGSSAIYIISINPIKTPSTKAQVISLNHAHTSTSKSVKLLGLVNPIDRAVVNKLMKYPPSWRITIQAEYVNRKACSYIWMAVVSLDGFVWNPRSCALAIGAQLRRVMESYRSDYLLCCTPDTYEWYWWVVLARCRALL